MSRESVLDAFTSPRRGEVKERVLTGYIGNTIDRGHR